MNTGISKYPTPVIHIGMPKTATKTLQWRLFAEHSEIYYLGRFDGSLKLVAKSKEELSENTFISFWDNYIYINRQDKKIIVLNKDDLTFIDEVRP